MQPKRWQYIKALQPPRPRMFWPASRGTFCENRSARKHANREYKVRFIREAIGRAIADLEVMFA